MKLVQTWLSGKDAATIAPGQPPNFNVKQGRRPFAFAFDLTCRQLDKALPDRPEANRFPMRWDGGGRRHRDLDD